MAVRSRAARFVALLALAGCDASGAVGADAGVVAEPPAPPSIAPCRAGWREVLLDGVVACDPWPEGGHSDCAYDEAHFPGTPGCARIGTPCAADGWPTDLPTGRAVVYVDGDAAPGGDGATRATAIATIDAGVAAAPVGAIVAIAVGTYEVDVNVGEGQTLWGACVDGTRLTLSGFRPSYAMLGLVGAGSGIRNLSLDSPDVSGIVGTGADATIVDVVVHGAQGVGVGHSGTGSLHAQRLVVREGRESPDGAFWIGVTAQDSAHVVLESVVIERQVGVGIVVSESALLEARDIAVWEPGPLASGIAGRGVQAESGGRAVVEGLSVERGHELGIAATGAGSSIEARDVVVRELLGEASGYGRGVDAALGGRIVLSRALVDGTRSIGVLSNGTGSTLELRDVLVRDVAAETSGSRGDGIQVNGGASLLAERVEIVLSHQSGLLADDEGTTVEATDLVVRDIVPRPLDELYAVGVWAQFGADVSLRRARVARTRLAAIAAVEGGSVTLEDVFIGEADSAACGATSCPMTSGGMGLVAQRGGTVRATRFVVEDVALCGVVVGADGSQPSTVDLERGVIDLAPIGACVQADGYDTSRLRREVEYRRVGVPLQATRYEVPDVIE